MKKVILYLVFAISAVAGQAQEPAIVMTTAKSINSQFTFGIEAAASNTPIQIDWGNGVKENYTVGNSLINFFSYPLKGNSVKIWGEGITKLYVASMELTALDVTRATSLTFLFITINQISTLDLSNCNALTFVDCSRNLLNRLNLPNTSTLNVNCANNRLTFATLPVKQPTWTAYSYSPQQNYTLPKQTYSTNEEIDLSSQLNVGSQTTTYTWKTESGTTLVNGTDYNENGGKFTFLNTFTDSLYCEMANPAFPDLILTTTKISIHQLPNVVMTTTSAVGSTFTFSIGATSSNATIKVDWGNGTLASYTIGENTTVSGTLAGSTIKIYGVDISYLGLSEKKLTSLDVTNNTALKSLDCSSNQITTLDVSKNSALTQLTCYKNQLTALDVSKNTALINLFCGFNQLSALDVSKNTALTQLLCNSNQLTAIDVSKNTALISLYCNSNLLTALNVFNNTSLTLLCCQSNQLTSLNVPNNSSLTTLWIDNNSLTFPTLPVKQTSWTSYIYSPQAKIVLPKTEYALNEEVDLSSQLTAGGNTTVYTWKTAGGKTLVKDEDYTENSGKFKFLKQPGDFLYCEMRNATFPDLTLSTEKISITQTDPSITMTTTSAIGSTFTFKIGATTSNTPIKVDWGNGTLVNYTIGEYSTVSGTLAGSTIKIYGLGIRNLDLSDKKLTSLDVTNNTALTNLNCSWNQITTLDVAKNIELETLYCDINKITTLDVSKNISLKELKFSFNQVTALDVTNNAALTYLDCSWNQITTLDVTKNTELSILNCSSNSLTTIDVTKNTELEILYCDHNKITTLDVSKNTELTQLMCSSNPLIALDITNNTKLIKLWCSSNLLTAIDVSKNTALTTLDCSLNQLTNLDVTNNTALTELYINNNILTFSTLPVKQTAWTKYIYSPQAKLVLPKKVYAHSEEIDLSSEFSVDGNITSFVWKTQNGRVLTKNIDYTEDNGIFRFLNPYMVDSIYCEMTNASFPLLTLVTQNITFPLTNPVITLTSSNPIGSNFELTIACEYKSAIKIDWGKGTISNHNVINSTFWRGLEDSNMKIYGVGIKKLNVSNNNITELNTSNCESLKELDCNSNKLKSIDISANTNLYKLNCSNNLLMFSNLPIVSFTAYTYSPQAIVNLAKKRYGLTETVDLSSESIINGNATNYVWKTKGGSTLTAGTDYNVTNGVTTFLKVQPDSVYCEMTNATFPALTLKTSSIKVSQFPLSVNDSKLSASVFPNPASELVTIELNENIFRVEIFNSLGIKLLEQKTDIAPRVVLPLNNIPAGILIVRAYTKNGYTENKIVKL